MRVAIRVKPGSARTSVGGRHGEALVVTVTARAVDGKATEAALRAVADAFDVRRRDVTLVTGAASRDKVVDIGGETGALSVRRDALLGPVRLTERDEPAYRDEHGFSRHRRARRHRQPGRVPV